MLILLTTVACGPAPAARLESEIAFHSLKLLLQDSSPSVEVAVSEIVGAAWVVAGVASGVFCYCGISWRLRLVSSSFTTIAVGACFHR